ncbi:MAG: glucose-1-phosphate cytidylyltransferase [Bacteroidales bacterium]|nr:glucose-1-phosphate cytidylyltransferase [Bacteroidales bacterium]MCF8405339.1 glucose-1-phosphate cytidylyltransferase [Bacteroidales bacterium]
MKTVILAGGFGTRISEETGIRPKPMVEIGGMPMLWHIMKMYSSHGFNDFVICCGYKGNMIKEYFSNYYLLQSNMTFNLRENTVEVHTNNVEPWNVTLIDTGENTMTGGRIKRIREYIGNERFFLTYGDGVSDVDFNTLLDFHKKQDTYATLTAVQPPGRFGAFSMEANSNKITSFREKPKADGHDSAWINGGFFVLEPEIFDYIEGDATVWEREPLENMASQNKLAAYQHPGYWQNMDTLRDKNVLEDIWSSGKAPWRNW